MKISPLRFLGITLATIMSGLVIFSILERDCVCTEDQDCFCLAKESNLHQVDEAEVQSLPEPQQSEYRHFLVAWEEEYTLRMREWADLYQSFHAVDRSTLDEQRFNQQLAAAHQTFVDLFRARHRLYRERLGLNN